MIWIPYVNAQSMMKRAGERVKESLLRTDITARDLYDRGRGEESKQAREKD